jgi:sarcosine oxidase
MARILVVGAGIVGLSVARAALQRGHAVTLIDQGDVPNPNAASHDQHRMIRMHYGAAEGYTRMAGQSFAAWKTLWQEIGVRHFADCGALAISVSPADYADQTLAVFRRLDVPHDVLDAAALERLCPQLDLPRTAWGLLARPGGPLFADRILHDLTRLVASRGAIVLPHTQAVEVDETAGSVTMADGRILVGDLFRRHRRGRLAARLATGRIQLAARLSPDAVLCRAAAGPSRGLGQRPSHRRAR